MYVVHAWCECIVLEKSREMYAQILVFLWCLITDAKKYAFNTKFYGYIALRSFY